MAVYGSGETIVRQGEDGQSMFVVLSGSVSVVLEPSREEVARIEPGGYFGEMSLLTGEPRTATVLAAGDVVTVEIGAEVFRRLAASHPEAIENRMAAVSGGGLEQLGPLSRRREGRTTNLMARMKSSSGYIRGARPSDSPTRSLARRFAGALRSRGSLAVARSLAPVNLVPVCEIRSSPRNPSG